MEPPIEPTYILTACPYCYPSEHDEGVRQMKMRHEVEATTLPKAKRAIAVAALAVTIAASSTATMPVRDTGKMLHDCCVWHRAA